ncbi:hypothetical protein NDU88_003573 [Pleurodeles waltl]|uniref:Uncharacterized protein n=1 Tax=Pleurodeles waltl TaxID=8319 RepID=A0AAV7VHR2_PLEWA|nr:hypothetical protein NDU88_003573 [Pleurodeles waltl]
MGQRLLMQSYCPGVSSVSMRCGGKGGRPCLLRPQASGKVRLVRSRITWLQGWGASGGVRLCEPEEGVVSALVLTSANEVGRKAPKVGAGVSRVRLGMAAAAVHKLLWEPDTGKDFWSQFIGKATVKVTVPLGA